MPAIRYAFEEAAASLWRGRRASAISAAIIALALFVLGAFLVVASNVDQLSREWADSAELSVYLDDDITPDARTAITDRLEPGRRVAAVELVTKEEAARRFAAAFADLSSGLEALGGNPLPASLEVSLGAIGRERDAMERLARELREMPGVTDVQYDRPWLDRLEAVVGSLQGVGVALGGVLALAALLAVVNVVRLSLVARRAELEIMHLVGAPVAYVRGPFVAEGMLQGGVGSVAALGALLLVFALAQRPYLAPLAAALNLSAVRFIAPSVSAALVLGGVLVGGVGGWIAGRRA